MKPRVLLLDADGPLFDLTGASVAAINRQFDVRYKADQWTQWDAHFMSPAQASWLRNTLWADPRFWAQLPPTEGAQAGVTALLDKGHEIHVVTSAFESCVGWESARRDALKGLFGIDKKFVTVTAQKHLVCGDVFVDDKVENVKAWSTRQYRGAALLFDMPHNRDHALNRVDWEALTERFG